VGQRARRTGVSKPVSVFSLAILTLVAALATVPASASSGINVFVGYADSLRANATNFPTPWAGSPQTTFEGCLPVASCEYDGGAVRIANNTGSTVTVNAITVHISTCTYTGWPSAILSPGADLIVAQLVSGASEGCSGPSPLHFDTSDIGPNGASWSGICTQSGVQSIVDLTVNGQTTTYTDSGQVLNTGGVDGAACPSPGGNESIQWTTIGHAPCRGSQLSLAPATQTHGVGTTATVTATFTNSCGQPLSNVAVRFAVLSGPNAGRSGTGATDANGAATFTYGSALAGTDTLQATVTNIAGSIPSNTVTVTWVLFAPGGGAFVISDLKDASGGSVYWWGAQWWKNDHLSGGLAPASFKGFENGNVSPWCGQSWTTRPGNSSRPPRTVPSVMAVIVSSHITKKGPVISGDIVHIVLVQTKPGYGPNPGHQGTGTIIAQLC
jgi:Big-like domain-containing protein